MFLISAKKELEHRTYSNDFLRNFEKSEILFNTNLLKVNSKDIRTESDNLFLGALLLGLNILG